MKKTILIVSTMLCIGLCVGGGITANAIEARYPVCPDIDCAGRIVEYEWATIVQYGETRECSNHPFCTQQLTWTIHYMTRRCEKCGFVKDDWRYEDNYHWICSSQQ